MYTHAYKCVYMYNQGNHRKSQRSQMIENLGITDGNLSKLEKYELQEFSFTREKKK